MSDIQLDKLLRPASIAVVGASERPDAIGTRVIANLRRLGFTGRIYPINPRYREVAGLACAPSLADLPERVDAAFFGVPAIQTPGLMEQAAAANVGAVFINANGFADGDTHGLALQQRVVDIARAHDIALCGPNNLGLINVRDRIAAWTPRYMIEPKEGPIALISQSGSIAIVLADDERKIGFSYLITAGNEAVLSAADYLRYCVRDSRVEVILLYLETIRKIESFAKAAREAREMRKPIVALKLGRSESGRALVQAHTGSLAGDDRLLDEFFRDLGIVRVRDLDEMVETTLVLTGEPKRPLKPDLVVVTLSGGEAALIADTASDLGVRLPRLSSQTIDRLRPAFPPYATIRNPVDAWGLGFNPERFEVVVNALLADPDIGSIAISVDAPGSGGADVPYACVMARACVDASTGTNKRFVFFNNMSGTGPNEEVQAILKPAGIPYLSGMRTALAAIGHSFEKPPRPDISEPTDRYDWGRPLPETETARFRMLSEAGIPMAECHPVRSQEHAVQTAGAIGYPVVLKGFAPNISHKSDLGLVRTALRDSEEVDAAYIKIAEVLAHEAPEQTRAEIYLQKMANPGIELIVGIRNEPGFGSFIVVGLGGVFVELLNNAALRLGPVDVDEAGAMLSETSAARMLSGVRGQSPFDVKAAASAIAALSRVGAATVGHFASIEINPLIVHHSGATGVDLLIEPAKKEKASQNEL